jgi:hypothetical protein
VAAQCGSYRIEEDAGRAAKSPDFRLRREYTLTIVEQRVLVIAIAPG